jgi:hypothetical protein
MKKPKELNNDDDDADDEEDMMPAGKCKAKWVH